MMNRYREIELANWPRKRMFEFYHNFDSPVFDLTVQLDGRAIRRCAEERDDSFFLLALYAILRAANAVPQMRQREVDGRILEFDRIAAMTPIMTEQEMFCQIWCEYADTFAQFKAEVVPLVEQAKLDEPSPMEEHGPDFFCATCAPLLHFTAMSPASFTFHQDVPILTWGKMNDAGELPVSCRFNHCFFDGLHVARFFDAIQAGFLKPETLYCPFSSTPLAE